MKRPSLPSPTLLFGGPILLGCLALWGCAAAPRAPHPAPPACSASPRLEPTPPRVTEPAPLLEGVGECHFPVTTGDPSAQTYFEQGVALVHGYWYYEAWRSFRQAARLDSSCAMAHWGVYQALSGDSPARKSALATAHRLRRGASEREQLYIAADVLLDSLGYGAGRGPYIRAMQDLIDRYPDDVEAGLFLIRFLMQGYDPEEGSPPGEPDPVEMLAELMLSHPDHIAVNHYWIHVIESGEHPERALASAERLPSLAPRAGHLVHMPGHIHYLLGNYDRARQAFMAAHAVDSTYMSEHNMPPAKTWNYIHNLNYLVANCAEDGRFAEGRRWAALLARIPLDPDRPIIFYQGRAALARLHLRYGFWDDGVAALSELSRNDTLRPTFARHYLDGLLAYARGMAALARGRVDTARQHAKVLKDFGWQFMIQAPDLADAYYAQRRVDFLEVLSLDLQGNVYSAAGQHDRARELLDQARTAEAALGYEEPPAYLRPVLESVGAARLRAGDPEAALVAYRELLEQRPRSGHALLGVARSLDQAGRAAETVAAFREFLEAWSQADPDLPQVEQARSWLARVRR